MTIEVKDDFTPLDKPPFIVTYERPGDNKIVIEGLTITTPDGKRILIDNLNAEIPQGSRIAIVGENGTGKTTTAKALTGNYDAGEGKVGVPSNMRENAMIMSQEAYLLNNTLRSILNKTPDESPVFSDEELTEVLQLVGHDRLIQHIPGQQTNILIDDLLDYAREISSDTQITIAELHEKLINKAAQLVNEQFEVVQHMPESSKEKLLNGLSDIEPIKNSALALTNDISTAVDRALLNPLMAWVNEVIEHEAHAQRGKFVSYSPWKAGYFAGVFAEGLNDRMKEYLANKDTDDKMRPIRINDAQRKMIVAEAQPKMKEAFKKNASKNPLSLVFNAAMTPVNLLTDMRIRAGGAAKNTRNALAFFMDTQVVKGSEFKRRLSGGEKQRLIFAKTLLHKPDLLIADEPTSALDEPTEERMFKILMQEMPKSSTIISIIHDLDHIKHHGILGELDNLKLTFSEVNDDTVARLRQKVIQKQQAAIMDNGELPAPEM